MWRMEVGMSIVYRVCLWYSFWSWYKVIDVWVMKFVMGVVGSYGKFGVI